MRRLLNTSLEYPKVVTDEILSNYMQKLLNSGYDHRFREDILLSVKNAYKKIMEKHLSGEKPRHRDRDFMKEERAKEKEEKGKKWFKKNNNYDSVMFIPITPGSVLKKRIQERLAGGILRIKLVEYTGPKIIELLKQRVNSGGEGERCGQDCLQYNGDNAQ